jgi:hypothetical protein
VPYESDRPASGSFQAIVTHSAPSAPPVDLYLLPADGTIAGATPLGTLAFGDTSPALDAPSGDYRIVLTPSGSQKSVYNSGPITLGSGDQLNLFAIDEVSRTSAVAIVSLGRDGSNATITNFQALVRVGHFSPGAPNVDVLVDDVTLLTDVPYLTTSPYDLLDAGERNVKLNSAGTMVTLLDIDATVADDAEYTLLAVDLPTELELLLLEDDNTLPMASMVRVRVVHGSPTAGTVDVYVTAPAVDIDSVDPTLAGVEFKQASDYLEIAEGDYRVRVTPAGTKMVVIDSGVLPLVAGQVRTAVAADDLGGGFTTVLLADRN